MARIALEEGAHGLALSTLEEAMTLREVGITAPLLLLGERQEALLLLGQRRPRGARSLELPDALQSEVVAPRAAYSHSASLGSR